MSSATLVVRQYEAASELSERFGCALIDLIRTWKRLPGCDDVSPAQLHSSRETALEVISEIERALADVSGNTPRHQGDVILPDGFVAWLKATHQGDAVKAHDLSRLRARLAQVHAQPGDADIALLERISQVLGAQTAHLFSRLQTTDRR